MILFSLLSTDFKNCQKISDRVHIKLFDEQANETFNELTQTFKNILSAHAVSLLTYHF